MKKLTLLLCFVVLNAYASIELTSFNIRNFDKKGKGTDKNALYHILKDLDSDIIAIQEIYNDHSFKKFINKRLPDYEILLSRCGGGGRQKLGFLYKKNKFELIKKLEDRNISDLDDIVSQYGCSSLRPAMIGFFKDRKTNKEFVAVSVHLKAGSGSRNYARRKKQYRYIVKMIRSLKLANHKDIILLGDFNTTGFDHQDSDFFSFSDMLSKTGTSTVSEKIKCTSYWSGPIYNDDIEEPSTLDHIVHAKNFLGMKLEKVEVGSHCKLAKCTEVYDSVLGRSYESVSDHCPVSANFK